MISENLKQLLESRAETSDLNFRTLIEFLSSSEYHFIGTKLNGAKGFATVGKAYFNISEIERDDDQALFFVFLHEYAHLLRIDKMGKDKMIDFLSSKDFDSFAEHVIEEETTADRFGCFYFHKLNGKVYPNYRTQQLTNEKYRIGFKYDIKPFFGKFGDEQAYDNMVKFIITG